ncbi:MAG: DUF2264 domain-containing protein [Actinomycetaceae bacterium]|nr:DUF2264 domain-containing protein [Actinomycetaceae bacterium]
MIILEHLGFKAEGDQESSTEEAFPDTGMGFQQWADFADELLLAVRPYFTPSHAKAHLPGLESMSGYHSDGLEGFARTFLLAGFRLAGSNADDPHEYAKWYREGLIAGTDPNHEDHWPSVATCKQAKVEAAAIAIMLDFTRTHIWDTLDDTQQSNVITWLSDAVGDDTYHHNNWRWFRIVVQTFLRSVGAHHNPDEIRADLQEVESFYRTDGWYADGNWRSYDHYVGWAMHLYPILWRHMQSAADFDLDSHPDVERLERFLEDFLCLVGSQGAPLYIGRSLIYRFAVIAPVWAGIYAGVQTPKLGALKRCANLVLRYFQNHGVPNHDKLLDMGWHEEWTPMRQNYSGPASPYWASKGLLGVALPPNHPVWQCQEQPLPAETADQLRLVAGPGWIVSATTDGIVRVINHGTDRGYPNDQAGDLPEYARYGYSNLTTPLLDEDSRINPLDQAAAVIDEDGRATHRAGFVLTDLGSGQIPAEVESAGEAETTDRPRQVTNPAAHAASVAKPHWMASTEVTDFGLPMHEVDSFAGELNTVSVVRGPWEVRLSRFQPDAENAERNWQIRVGGWPLSSSGQAQSCVTDESGKQPQVEIECDGLRSRIADLPLPGDALTDSQKPAVFAGSVRAQVDTRTDASPIGANSYTPTLTYPCQAGRWQAVAVYLGRETTAVPQVLQMQVTDDQMHIVVAWPDLTTTHTITLAPQPKKGDAE